MQNFPEDLQDTLNHIAAHGLAAPIRVAMMAVAELDLVDRRPVFSLVRMREIEKALQV